jgi:hypothetical protein
LHDQYLIRIRGKVLGPFTVEELQSRSKRGGFSRLHQVSSDGINWRRATEFPELFPQLPRTRARQQPVEMPDSAPTLSETMGELLAEENVEPIFDLDDGYALLDSAPATGVEATGPEALWYYSHNAEENGPVPFSQLQALATAGQLAPADLVWTDSIEDWTEAYRVPGIFVDPLSSEPLQTAPAVEPMGTSPMAVGSFVLGLLGASIFFFLGSIAAVVFGHVALRQIRASRNSLGGRGMAITGLILGYAIIITTTAVGVVVLCIYMLRGVLAGPA